MKKTFIIAVIIMAAVRLSAQEPTKDTVRIERNRVELQTNDKGKPQFVLHSDDNAKTRKVNTDNKQKGVYIVNGKKETVR